MLKKFKLSARFHDDSIEMRMLATFLSHVLEGFSLMTSSYEAGTCYHQNGLGINFHGKLNGHQNDIITHYCISAGE